MTSQLLCPTCAKHCADQAEMNAHTCVPTGRVTRRLKVKNGVRTTYCNATFAHDRLFIEHPTESNSNDEHEDLSPHVVTCYGQVVSLDWFVSKLKETSALAEELALLEQRMAELEEAHQVTRAEVDKAPFMARKYLEEYMAEE